MLSRAIAALVAALAFPMFTSPVASAETVVLAQADNQCSVVVPQIKDDTQNPPVWVDPASLSFALDEAAIQDLPQDLGPIPAGPAYLIGATQVSGVPWLGVNTMNPSLLNNTQGDVHWELTGFSGPGAMYVFTQGGMGQVVGEEWFIGDGSSASGSTVVERNRHVHPNWLFSAPGTYHVELTQTVQLLDGSESSGTATLTFEVGTGAGTVNDGHFDFGPTIGTGSGEECGGESTESADFPTTDSEVTASDSSPKNNKATGAQPAQNTRNAHSQQSAQPSQRQPRQHAQQAAPSQQHATKQLPNTGPTVMTLPIAILALGILALGTGLVFAVRHFRWF